MLPLLIFLCCLFIPEQIRICSCYKEKANKTCAYFYGSDIMQSHLSIRTYNRSLASSLTTEIEGYGTPNELYFLCCHDNPPEETKESPRTTSGGDFVSNMRVIDLGCSASPLLVRAQNY